MEQLTPQDVLRHLDNEGNLTRYPRQLTDEISKKNNLDVTFSATLLDLAVYNKDIRAAELILSDGAQRVVPSLEIAVANSDNAEMIDMICQHRNISQMDKDCLLAVAVTMGEMENVKALLKNGANAKNAVNCYSSGENIIEVARKKGYTEIAELLEGQSSKDADSSKHFTAEKWIGDHPTPESDKGNDLKGGRKL